MSLLERRVQILLDPTQYEQVQREAVRTGQSAAALIRDAIAERLSSRDAVREAAATSLLASVDDSVESEDWQATKTALHDELAAKLP
ncbi:MAG: ribbon-helix-helix protein, CopG family [Nocardioidaceae bacterium]